jgi:predicted nucleotidyltransferase
MNEDREYSPPVTLTRQKGCVSLIVIDSLKVLNMDLTVQRVLDAFRSGVECLYTERLRRIILYGSWARGEATENSDIDVAVVLGGEVAPGYEIDRMIDLVTQINLDFGVLLSVYPVSERDFMALNSPLLRNIRKEGIAA